MRVAAGLPLSLFLSHRELHLCVHSISVRKYLSLSLSQFVVQNMDNGNSIPLSLIPVESSSQGLLSLNYAENMNFTSLFQLGSFPDHGSSHTSTDNTEVVREGSHAEAHGTHCVAAQVNSKRKDYLNEDDINVVRRYEAQVKREYRKRRRAQKEVQISNNIEGEEGPREDVDVHHKRRQEATQNIVQHILTALSNYRREDKNAIMQGVLSDERILQCSEDLSLHSNGLISALRVALQELKIPKSSDEIFLKRSTFSMLVNGLMQNNESPGKAVTLNQAAKLLNVHPRNFYSALDRVDSDPMSGTLTFESCKRKSSYGGLSDEVKEIVITFWIEHTRVSPNKKDICRK